MNTSHQAGSDMLECGRGFGMCWSPSSVYNINVNRSPETGHTINYTVWVQGGK